jgi:hypothetical protein
MLKSGLSYADFVVAEHLNTIFSLVPSLKLKYPELVNYMEKIHTIPQIAEYVKTRPVTSIWVIFLMNKLCISQSNA